MLNYLALQNMWPSKIILDDLLINYSVYQIEDASVRLPAYKTGDDKGKIFQNSNFCSNKVI